MRSSATPALHSIAAALIAEGMRAIVDDVLQAVHTDCLDCRAQDADPLGIWRPVTLLLRGGKVSGYCNACGRTSDA